MKKRQQPLLDGEQRFQSLVDLTIDYYWEQDGDQCFIVVCRSRHVDDAQSMQHYLGKTFWDLEDGAASAKIWEEYRALFSARHSIRNLVFYQAVERGDGRYFSISAEPVFDEKGVFTGYCGITRNVTQEKRNEEYASTFELAAVGLAHVDANGKFIQVNRTLCEMLGYTEEELLDLTVKQISHPEDVGATSELRAKLHSGEIDTFTLEKRYLRKNSEPIWVKLTVAVKLTPSGRPLYDISVLEDISVRKATEERVQYLATHDDMTGLPNRMLFSQLLKLMIESAVRYERQFAVMFIDLDRFKQINDSLGHDAGDILLQEMAKRFRACLRSSDVVARLGGDEFVVLLQETENSDQVSVVARNILSAALKPMEVLGQECRVTTSIGISMFPEDGIGEQDIMKNADIAMYQAKEEGKNNFQFYSPTIKSHSIEKMILETHLRRAIELNEFSVHYQAKVNIKTGKIKGAEALLRWNNPVLGVISPMQFIPVAEEIGLIIPLGKWVMKKACEQNLIWQQNGLPSICIAVNLSPRQFADPDLILYIRELLKEMNLDPAFLELEITESMMMHDTEKAIQILTSIKQLGVRVAIDDFGTGYSSLSQLKLLPVNTLKVDRSFIRELHSNPHDKAITQAIITMGKTLGLTVVAEGVETAEQKDFLRDNDCDEMQGFYFSKAISPEEFEMLLKAHG